MVLIRSQEGTVDVIQDDCEVHGFLPAAAQAGPLARTLAQAIRECTRPATASERLPGELRIKRRKVKKIIDHATSNQDSADLAANELALSAPASAPG